ncbi:MAG: RNA polymerase sigma-70 factor [Cytophagaceae bacterium]|nr:RNA polymerase sigma-70 factor [Cytophagaceae bacterium]
MQTQVIFEDEASYRQAFKLHYAALCRMVYRILRDKDVCEDIVQDLFVRVWEKRNSIYLQGSVKSYLYRSAMNAALNHVQSKKVKTRAAIDDVSFELQGGHLPDEISQADDLQTAFQKALQELPEGCREIFMLSRYEQLSYKEIAETLEISPKTVENQMGKALRVLREKLGSFLQTAIGLLFLLKL